MTTLALGNVTGDGNNSASHLRCQAEKFLARKRLRATINIDHQIHRALPHNQVTISGALISHNTSTLPLVYVCFRDDRRVPNVLKTQRPKTQDLTPNTCYFSNTNSCARPFSTACFVNGSPNVVPSNQAFHWSM
jgi:hypothetical protein